MPADLPDLDPALYLAGVLVLAAVSQWLAWRVRVPSILVLLVVGFGAGSLVEPDAVLDRELLFAGVTLAVGVILFEGSLSLRFSHVRELGAPVVRLCTVTVLLAWPLITMAAWAVGVDWRLALLLGAILVVTGPTVINPILRQLRPTRRVASLLRWEGIVVDPIGAVLAVLVYQAVIVGSREEALGTAAGTLLVTVCVAVGIAGILALVLWQAMRRHLVPDFLQGVVFLAAAIGALTVSNVIQEESGLLTVTLLGIALGNAPGLHLDHVQEFKEHLQVLLVGVLFVVLAGRVSWDEVVAVAPTALLFVALLVLVVRPVSVLVSLLGTSTTREERVLLAGMAPRGIVAAAVTSIFALELEHAAAEGEGADGLAALAAEAGSLVPMVFVTIVVTVAVYGLGVGRLAERLGLATTRPQGVVFAGSQEWVRQAALELGRLGVPTVLISQDRQELSLARQAGDASYLRTEHGNVLSEYVVDELDLAGIASFVAATDSDGTNTTATRELARDLGRAHTFQLRRADAPPATEGGGRSGADRTGSAERLSARVAFDPPLTFEEMEERTHGGMVVRSTRLTEEYPLEAYRRDNPDAVLLFANDGSTTTVVTEDEPVPDSGVTLIALTRPRGGGAGA